MNPKKLSVCLITYNHAKYIRSAIDGVLMQKVDFSWELIIADDFSTDGTREIILEYKEKYPDFITLILQKENVGPAQNFLDLISSPLSEYVAYFEGDDYWTDPLKLQSQVEFLITHPDYSLCYHRVETKADLKCQDRQEDYTFYFYTSLKGKNGATLSMVYRNRKKVLSLFKLSANQLAIGDWPLECILMLDGNGYFMNQIMGVYNPLQTGVTATRLVSKKNYFESRKGFFQNLLNYAELSPTRRIQVRNLLRLHEIAEVNYVINTRKFSCKLLWSLMGKYMQSVFLWGWEREYEYSYKKQLYRTLKIIRHRIRQYKISFNVNL